ncbi:MAG: class I SAM-dependent methyltransferase [Actinomycetes bacterium]|nr:class I SAM-dependent methyltransferase [Actinomycetes bacterium]
MNLARIHNRLRRRLPRFGSFRSPEPVNPDFGWAAGTPVDRYYLDQFLAAHADAIAGRVLEIGGRDYTLRFGAHEVSTSIVLTHAADEQLRDDPDVIRGDLTACPDLADGSVDCVLLPHVLQYLPDVGAALRELARILAPGGTALIAVPCISQISRWDDDRFGDRWRFTSRGLRELLTAAFPPPTGSVEVTAYGNAFSALCGLEGIPLEQIDARELKPRVADYEVLVCAAVRKSA